MKKTKKALSLRIDTIRNLSTKELTLAIGGLQASMVGTVCNTCASSCPLTACGADGC